MQQRDTDGIRTALQAEFEAETNDTFTLNQQREGNTDDQRQQPDQPRSERGGRRRS